MNWLEYGEHDKTTQDKRIEWTDNKGRHDATKYYYCTGMFMFKVHVAVYVTKSYSKFVDNLTTAGQHIRLLEIAC